MSLKQKISMVYPQFSQTKGRRWKQVEKDQTLKKPLRCDL